MQNSMMHLPLVIGSLADHVERFHAATEVVSVETTGEVTRTGWGAVIGNARRLASALEMHGVMQGDRCGTIAWNTRRHLEIYFGVSGGGMVCHTLNPRLAAEQLVYIVNDARDRVLFIDRGFVPTIAGLIDQMPTVKMVVMMGARDEALAAQLDGLQFYDELIAQGDAAFQWPQIAETEPSSLCYTSGTTGHPKGVLYTHRSTLLHTLAGNSPDGLALSARDSVMPAVPMFHVNAWGVPYIAAAVGAKLVLPGPKLDGESLARLIAAERVSLALGVPTVWLGLLQGLEATGADVSCLKRAMVGGTALPPSMIAEFRDRYGVDLVHLWGMTETSPLGTVNQLLQKHVALPPEAQAERRLAQGRPPYGVQLRLVDSAGHVLPHDGVTQGELQIRGHWIVDTYYNKDRSALTFDGWFDTGDIATIDPDGYMVIRDRSKDIIKSGGEWISTVELENIAIAHPAVANAAAIAARHPKWDERPVVIVQRHLRMEVSEEEILACYKGKVPNWQIPDRVLFIDNLPLGATGKVVKARLRELYGEVLMPETAEAEPA
ncbi:long-chain fatty acid--CoA ligase [Rhodobacter capsulatus]|jgi:fatty-acyl-CoA synthase|uniref:AMP-dependent synthetase and ligase family protein n=1 Tax=Rhodobacter capsulatus (strain ATCC BAA-309 / NBRC 16581 / SB1003) TaxID=272942 RepID=D5ATK2_RHOCB|nr:long-chain fatty acid--CoA ligase [Rhodobacter capsulatus]ADE85291.1 AMP-dependent synthetase and ligase family protein [Rhodobacter capsulatus SB 1003]ETD02010.1 long-chain fatty acid--CoA ligase [Rhodobacter capsulatus DE442]ETD77051.1 long-chain fatty acid--CoA ligase [Rhodobacter capsulatus R121]ETE54008.1 long-chain fatty acid--CoA ligase [Rhodobacter capsulatus Y262]MDS0927001.1 long-chain fatty acid--CoA ligase [Rhodobacter capsulatus]